MTCYVISCPSLGLCKIGYASDVARRFPLIRASAPAPVQLIATREGSRGLEAAIHRALADDRVHGEWFKLTERTLSVFEETVQPDSRLTIRRNASGQPEEVSYLEPAASIIRILGGAKVVSEVTGTAKTAPYRWKLPASEGGTDGEIPRKYIPKLMAFAHAKGIALTRLNFAGAPIDQEHA